MTWLTWLWSPLWPHEGDHALLLCDQFSGICRDVKVKLTKLQVIKLCCFDEHGEVIPLKYCILFWCARDVSFLLKQSCQIVSFSPFKNLESYLDVKKVLTSDVWIYVCSFKKKRKKKITNECECIQESRPIQSVVSSWVVEISCSASAREVAGLKTAHSLCV